MGNNTIKTTDGSEVFRNDIMLYLQMFCEEQGIDSMKKESQSVWNGALRYIQKRVFIDRDILKSKENLNVHNNSIPSNFNAYDYEIIGRLCDVYIDLCFCNDKEVSIIGFCNLTGISHDTIHEWGNGNVVLSPVSTDIYKKLKVFREESLSNKLVSGRQNPVGVLGVLNHCYGWNMPGTKEEQPKTIGRTPEQIMEQYGQKLSENGGHIGMPGLPE